MGSGFVSPASGSLAGRVVGDRYGVLGLIAEGGMGVVYEAEHLAIGKRVALKVLHPRHARDREAISRLRHEARVAGTLGHPNICAIHDMGRLDDGSPYLVLERLHGETLAQRLAREGRISAGDVVDILLQVLSALAAAHQQGVVHRDLKPDNIFLSQREGMRPVPKLLDFGISRADAIEDSLVAQADALLAAGTPFYMAPEQARGDRHFDGRIDLWAVGVVLYEGLTGQRPFQARNYNALLVEILNVAPRSILEHDPSLSVGLSRVAERALAKRPEDRYQGAIEFQDALRSYKDRDVRPPQQGIAVTMGPLLPGAPNPGLLRSPFLVNESTSDDGDSTHVFSRVDMGLAQSEEPAAPVLVDMEDEETPLQPPAMFFPVIDDERTVVDPPSFLHEEKA